MSGMLKKNVVEEVKERVRLDEVVSSYVSLKPGGTDTLKGLCPFHDEKTPSFTVRPNHNRWHCFGCGESGDAIEFIRRIEHIGFVEAVEILAAKVGVTLEYETTGQSVNPETQGVKRSRLIDAHRVAREFYIQSLQLPEAHLAQTFLRERGFDAEAIKHFQIGYSPDSWDGLLTVLRKKGFTEKEILESGLAIQGNNGLYDRFRGRLMWPIHSVVGDPIGFGARRLKDDDTSGAKYLNSPETLIYKKSRVLYGLDLAKRSIVNERKVVIVEGYTDVMAAHLAGVTTAVATCGTAFGAEHAKIIRGFLGDAHTQSSGLVLHNGKSFGGEIIYTFDGDNAGQKAAMKAYVHEQSFGVQTFVAVAPAGMDPCELRLKFGDARVRELIEQREPLFAFVIRSFLEGLDLSTAEGRTIGLYRTAQIVADIKDPVLRQEYVNILAGWLGQDVSIVQDTVKQLYMRSQKEVRQITQGMSAEGELGENAAPIKEYQAILRPLAEISDPAEKTERVALQVLLQLPKMAYAAKASFIASEVFVTPIYRTVHQAILAMGGINAYHEYFTQLIGQEVAEETAEQRANIWYIQQVLSQCGQVERQAVNQLVAESIEHSDPQRMWEYVRGVMMSLIRTELTRRIAVLQIELQRTPHNEKRQQEIFAQLMQLEAQRKQFSETDRPE